MDKLQDQKLRRMSGLPLTILLWALPLVSLTLTLCFRDRLNCWYADYAYHFTFALVAIWAWVVFRFLSERGFSLRNFAAENIRGLLVCAVLMAVIVISVKPEFRILYDEPGLLNVSRAMTNSRRADAPGVEHRYYGVSLTPVRYIDKRPPLFPFLVHLFHTVSGFRPANAFALNIAVGFCVLFLGYAVFRRRLGEASALAAPFFIASYPLFSLYATSGGFDLLAAFLVMLSCVSLYIFIDGEDGRHFNLMWMTFLLLSFVRYESPIYLPLALLLLLLSRRLSPRGLLSNPIVPLTLPLLLPILWQRYLFNGVLGTYSKTLEQGVASFSFSNFINNSADFLISQRDFGIMLPHNNLLNIFSLLLAGWCLLAAMRGRILTRNNSRISAGIICAIGCAYLCIFLSHYSMYSSLISTRFYILFSLAAALSPLVFSFFIIRVKPALLIGLSLAMFAFYHPYATVRRPSQVTTAMYRFVTEYLQTKGLENIFIISDFPGQYIALDYGAADFSYAGSNAAELLRLARERAYEDILVVQEITPSTGLPKSGNELPGELRLEALKELGMTGGSYVRISRIKL